MYDIKNLTNEVQYLSFRSGKDCFLAGKDSLTSIRDSEITPVINKMSERKIISLKEIKSTPQGSVKKTEPEDERETGAQDKGKSKAPVKTKK